MTTHDETRPVKPQQACEVQGCGRPARTRGLCQTHYKQWRATRTVGAIHPRQPDRAGTIRLGGLSVSRECAEEVARHAREHGSTINAVVTDVLEAWGRRYWARLRARGSKP